MDPDGILLSTEAMKIMLDFDTVSWPVLAVNADCNLNFDIPFAADGLDTANTASSVSPHDNDRFSYLNQLSQPPIDLTEPSGELDKISDLNAKVRLSNINYFLRLFYALTCI